MWLLDRGWVVFAVEFQPSAYSKGSFLNVGAHFLWTWNDYLSFDHGYRVENFVQFESAGQFSEAAEHLARRAAEELRNLDENLPTPSTVGEILPESLDRSPWVRYHRAISRALSGESSEAADLFRGLAAGAAATDWEQELATRSRRFVTLLHDRSAFIADVSALVQEHRAKLGLAWFARPIFGDQA